MKLREILPVRLGWPVTSWQFSALILDRQTDRPLGGNNSFFSEFKYLNCPQNSFLSLHFRKNNVNIVLIFENINCIMSYLFSEKYSLNKIRHDNKKFNHTRREFENLSFSLSCPSLVEVISYVVCIRVFIVNVSRMWTMSCWQPSLPPLASQLLFLAGSRSWSAARKLASAPHQLAPPHTISHGHIPFQVDPQLIILFTPM